MIRDQNIKEELTQLDVLRSITSVYGQLASLWMTRARDSILSSRQFVDEMNEVFNTVFSSYIREVLQAAKKNSKQDGRITFLAHNGKKVAVFLSSNTGFYGEIIEKTFELFLKDVRSGEFEATIVGKQGVELFQREEPYRPYTFFELSDEVIDRKKLADLIRHLVQYKEIRVYYGKFENFLSQRPVVFDVSANPYDNLREQDKTKRYIFEPDLNTMLAFFEKEIFSSVFEQTLKESQLAKAASRIMVMDRAGENIKERLKMIKHQESKLAHSIANRKQMSTFVSVSLWNNTRA